MMCLEVETYEFSSASHIWKFRTYRRGTVDVFENKTNTKKIKHDNKQRTT